MLSDTFYGLGSVQNPHETVCGLSESPLPLVRCETNQTKMSKSIALNFKAFKKLCFGGLSLDFIIFKVKFP